MATVLHEASATQIVSGIQAGKFSVEDIARSCLKHLPAHNDATHAWETVDPDAVVVEAQRLDRAPTRGPLHGVPIGVKDVIDTAQLPTQMGSPLYAGNQPRYDAACVALARAAGALVLGKTVTAEFAGTKPTTTRNPRNLTHTPGGSSSGSAAAVAAKMVPVAFGTQTGGSVLRPAAFCGVIGFKPTFGLVNTEGVKSAATSLDTIGLLARTIDDVTLFHRVLTATSDNLVVPSVTRPRIGVYRSHLWDTVQHETVVALEDAATRLGAAGAVLIDVDELSFNPARLTAERVLINGYERARGLAHEWFNHRDGLSDHMIRVCEAGFQVTAQQYLAAQRYAEKCRLAIETDFGHVDAVLTPTAPGEAPRGYDYPGDPRLQELWTLLHMPAITLPTHCGPHDLPVGIQLVASRDQDLILLACAAWALESLGQP